VGQNPRAQQIQAALMAHINEHVAYQYRIEIEKMLGVQLPPEGESLPEEVEVQISRAVAEASDKLLQKDQAEAQEQRAQQLAQDPVVQMQQREVEIKEAELQRKVAKDQMDAQLKMQDQQQKDERERMRIASQEQIAGAQIGAKSVDLDKQIASKELVEGTKIGAKFES